MQPELAVRDVLPGHPLACPIDDCTADPAAIAYFLAAMAWSTVW